VSGRQQRISPEALTDLTNDIFETKEQLSAKRQRLLEPILAKLEISSEE
jgi:hypothetical protein